MRLLQAVGGRRRDGEEMKGGEGERTRRERSGEEEERKGRGIKEQQQDWSMEGKTMYLKCLRGRFTQSLVAELTVSHKQHHNLRREEREEELVT